MLHPGDPVSSFHAPGIGNPRFAFDTVAGRHVAICFVGSSRIPGIDGFVEALRRATDVFDDAFACAFLVSADPDDMRNGRLADRFPGIRVLGDHDQALARRFGCLAAGAASSSSPARETLHLTTFILDPGLRVLEVLPMRDPRTHAAEIVDRLARCRQPDPAAPPHAPVLTVPRVFEPGFCRELIAHADATGTEDSGFMRSDPVTGKTVLVIDHAHKRREDCLLEEPRLRDAVRARIVRRLVPAIEGVFQFKATRMERYLIARYDAKTGGHFRPHKDNTTLGTAHRRFAVSIGLDADGYEGGDLRFPAFGSRTYRPPTGGAIVFSCSLLHEALPVVRGRRFVFLPFLYDEPAAKIRLENLRHLQDDDLRAQLSAALAEVG